MLETGLYNLYRKHEYSNFYVLGVCRVYCFNISYSNTSCEPTGPLQFMPCANVDLALSLVLPTNLHVTLLYYLFCQSLQVNLLKRYFLRPLRQILLRTLSFQRYFKEQVSCLVSIKFVLGMYLPCFPHIGK